MSTKKVKSAKERIAGAKKQRRHARVNLRGDLVAEIDALDDQLRDMRDKPGGTKRLADDDGAAIAARITRLQEQMEGEWLDLVLEQKPWAEWRAFKSANPPRDGEEFDKISGVDFDVLTEKFMPTCVVDPELDAEDWAQLFAVCAPADLRDLGSVAYSLHERTLDIPKSRLASAATPRSDDSSERLAAGG